MEGSSLSLLVKHLSPEQQREVSLDLLGKFTDINAPKGSEYEYISQFCNLLKNIPEEIRVEFYNIVLDYCKTAVINLSADNTVSSLKSIRLLGEAYPKLSEALIEFALNKIELFFTQNQVSFEKALIEKIFTDVKESINTGDEGTVEEIKHMFKFLESLFISTDTFHVNDKVDSLCYIFVTVNDEELSSLALKVLKWRFDSICSSSATINKLFEVVFQLMKSNDKTLKSAGFVLWLKYFKKMGIESLFNNEQFQEMISLSEYWDYLKQGLVSQTHEHKKYSLTLIQLTLQCISTDISIDNHDMSWVAAEREKYITAWNRFCTLFEIVGIDSSVNQTYAAFSDLNALFSPNSVNPVGFSLCILAVGLSNSLESVRKLFVQVVFSLDKENLHVFKYARDFLEDIFLPFAINAKNLKVIKTMDDVYRCDFGKQLQNFITNCVSQLNTAEEISLFSETILSVLVKHNLAFDPSKIYLSYGLLEGLQKKNIKGLNAKHLEILNSLVTWHAEGFLFETTLQTIYVRLMLLVDVQLCPLSTLLQTLGNFVLNNGYDVFIDNQEFFIDFITESYEHDELLNFFSENFKLLDIETTIISLSLLFSVYGSKQITSVSAKLLSYPEIDLLLVTLLHSKLDFNDFFTETLVVSKVERLFDSMLSGTKEELDVEIYSRSNELVASKQLFNEEFWMSIELNELFDVIFKSLTTSDSIEDLTYAIAQFKFFTACVGNCIYNENFNFTFDNFAELSQKAFSNQSKSGALLNFYRTKDEFFGLVATCFTELLKIVPVSTEATDKVLSLCDSFGAHSEFLCPLANVKLMSTLIEVNDNGKSLTNANAHMILDIMKTTWNDLTADRLVLTHKILHQQFIILLMNKTLLKLSIDDEELAEKIFAIAEEVIEQSFFRKALLPVLFKCISDYQLEDNESFEKTHWLGRVLVHGNYLLQTDHNAFKIDIVIANDVFNPHLNMMGDDIYDRVYGDLEVSYKVLISGITASIKSVEFAKYIWDYIIDNESIFHLHRAAKPRDSEEQWRRIQLFQMMLMCIQSLTPQLCLGYMKDAILKSIFWDPSPLCRNYMEWMIAYCIYTLPESKDDLFGYFIDDVMKQKPSVVTMFERISYLVAHKLNQTEEAERLREFISKYLIPAASSNRAVNRHFSVSLICSIYPEIVEKDLKLPVELIDALKGIYDLAVGADGFGTHRHGDALLWDIIEDLNLCGLSGGVLLKISDREVDAIREAIYHKYLPKAYVEQGLLRIPIGHDEESKWIQAKRSNEIAVEKYFQVDTNSNDLENATESSLLQIKSGAWATVLKEIDQDSVDLDEENVVEGANGIRKVVKRSPLIVVSSLVDKAPNLGGICRLCDVLGAGWMTVDDIKIKEDFEFQAVAVTADQWMPIIEVKIGEITEFMRLKKREGYTLIGLEQTDKSVELNNDLKFPEKSLILLGKEREGIPGELLAELDMCVIIKQVGVIRSMNIQTATAVMVHAYSSQHC